MAISRITTWADGQALTAADLNAEFNNILNNATSLISPLTGDLDFNLNNATNFAVEVVASNPTTVTTGRLVFNTVGHSLRQGISGQGSTGYFPVAGGGPGRVQGLSGSIVSNIGSFQAEGYMLCDPTFGTASVAATSSFSINTQTAGPINNGRDQAAAFGSTDIHFYAFTNAPRKHKHSRNLFIKPSPHRSHRGRLLGLPLLSQVFDGE